VRSYDFSSKASYTESFSLAKQADSSYRALAFNTEFLSDTVFIFDRAASSYPRPTPNINSKKGEPDYNPDYNLDYNLDYNSATAPISASKLGLVNISTQFNTQSPYSGERDELSAKDTEPGQELQVQDQGSTAALTQAADIIGLFAVGGGSSDFLSVAVSGRISLWNLKSGRETVLLKDGQAIAACAYHPAKKLLAISEDTGVTLFDLETRSRLRQSPGLGTKSAALEFAPDGKSILVGGEDGKVYRWRLQENLNVGAISNIEIERYIGHSAAVTALAYHPFSRMFFSADSFGSLAAWLTYDKDLFGGKYDERYNQTTYYAEDGPRGVATVADATTVLSLRISRDGQNIFSALQG